MATLSDKVGLELHRQVCNALPYTPLITALCLAIAEVRDAIDKLTSITENK
jgi:hypothetical protein